MYDVNIYTNCIDTQRDGFDKVQSLQPLDNCCFGPLKSYLKNEAASFTITQYFMARALGLLSKVASVGAGVSTFESVGLCPFGGNRVPSYLFSISDTSETITPMETACPNMALVCVPTTSIRWGLGWHSG